MREVVTTLSILGVHIIRPKDEVHGPIVHLRHISEGKKEEK